MIRFNLKDSLLYKTAPHHLKALRHLNLAEVVRRRSTPPGRISFFYAGEVNQLFPETVLSDVKDDTT